MPIESQNDYFLQPGAISRKKEIHPKLNLTSFYFSKESKTVSVSLKLFVGIFEWWTSLIGYLWILIVVSNIFESNVRARAGFMLHKLAFNVFMLEALFQGFNENKKCFDREIFACGHFLKYDLRNVEASIWYFF